MALPLPLQYATDAIAQKVLPSQNFTTDVGQDLPIVFSPDAGNATPTGTYSFVLGTQDGVRKFDVNPTITISGPNISVLFAATDTTYQGIPPGDWKWELYRIDAGNKQPVAKGTWTFEASAINNAPVSPPTIIVGVAFGGSGMNGSASVGVWIQESAGATVTAVPLGSGLSIVDGSLVATGGGGGGAVSAVFGRTGNVVAQSGDYTAAQVGADPSGAATAAQAASQPLDSDLTAIAALSTTAFGRNLLTLANAAAGQTAFGLGTASTHATTDFALSTTSVAGHALSGNVTIQASDLTNGTTGTGAILLQNGATLKDAAGTPKLSIDANARQLKASDGTTVNVDYSTPSVVGLVGGEFTFADGSGADFGGNSLSNVEIHTNGSEIDLGGANIVNAAAIGAVPGISFVASILPSARQLIGADGATVLADWSGATFTAASPAFTGAPTAPTASTTDSSQILATTSFVQAVLASALQTTLKLKGDLDCSANPNYPAGVVGDEYRVSVAGKVGGASGTSVDVSDSVICKTNNAGGTQAGVGASWFILEHNLVGALVTSNALSELAAVAATARSNIGAAASATTITIDGTTFDLSANRTFTISTITGNAGTATALATPRAINGVPFDGSAAITVPIPIVWTTVKTTTYAAAAGDGVPCDTTSGGFTVTLPTAPVNNTLIAIKHVIQGGTNVITYACGGSDVINKASGATSGTLAVLAQSVMLQYKATGAIWYVLATDVPLTQLDLRYVTPTSTTTFTNKRTTKRTGSATSSATPTINTDNVDIYSLTAQAADITSFTTNLSGTPNDGDYLEIRITGTGARAITWGASFVATTTALPTTTVSTTTLRVLFQWNATVSKWECLAAA